MSESAMNIDNVKRGILQGIVRCACGIESLQGKVLLRLRLAIEAE